MRINKINIKNHVCSYHFNNSIEAKKKADKILIDEKNFQDLMIYFSRYVRNKSIKILIGLYKIYIIQNNMYQKI